MKLKKKIIIFIIFFISIIGGLNVQAEETTNINPLADAAWPKSYNYKGEFDYTIENIQLKVYKLDSKNIETTTSNNNGIISTITTSKDCEKYLRDEPYRVITLSPNDYTLNPEYKEGNIYNYNSIFVNLNLNITNDKLLALLNEEYNKLNKDISYISEIVVNYKLTQAPVKYKFFMNVNTFKRLFSILLPELNIENKVSAINKTNSQVINIATLELNDNGQKVFNYEPVLSNTSNNSIFSLNYLAMSEKEVIKDNENDDTYQLLMFHNYPNIDYLIQNYRQIENNTQKEIKNSANLNSEVIKVENTSSKIPLAVYIISTLAIFAGVIIILSVLNKQKN